MDDYLAGLIFIAVVVIVFAFFQHKNSMHQQLLKNYNKLETKCSSMLEERRRAEFTVHELEKEIANSMKCKKQLRKTMTELRKTKISKEYLSAMRLENAEKYIATCIQSDNPSLIFLETFPPMRRYTLRDRLTSMLDNAKFEIDIVSPWIKRSAWENIKIPLIRFIRKGGVLKVFLKNEQDFSRGLGDDIRMEVEEMGGETIPIKHLHAKLYLVDRKEAIIGSANLTGGGVEGNLEAGMWSNNPALISEICKFIDKLYQEYRR
jgi:phosphatidylserine/phosphatidylglycerophosphate/cardiolipin synthase-like enzyme